MYRDREVPPPPVGDWAHVHDVPVDNLSAWHGRLPQDVLARSRRAYYAQVAHIDSQIGRVMRTIERQKIGPTAFIFTADHGEMLGDHHLFRKCYAYEGSAAVPLIVALPGERRGGFCKAPVTLEDIYPTVLELAGASVPERTEGRSLLPLCRGGSDVPWRQFVHGEHSACYSQDEAMQFLTDGKAKYIWFTRSGREQLFDLGTDPRELHDISADPAAKDRLAAWRARMVERLAARPQDGLSDGQRLIPGKLLPAVRPELLAGGG
jgi:arylsulfatase A-like enzyme